MMALHRQVSSHSPTSSPQQDGEHCKEELMGQVKETIHNNCHRINTQLFHLSPLREADKWGMRVEVRPQKLPYTTTPSSHSSLPSVASLIPDTVLDELLQCVSIPPNEVLQEKIAPCHSSCWETCGLPSTGRGLRSLLWHVLSMVAASCWESPQSAMWKWAPQWSSTGCAGESLPQHVEQPLALLLYWPQGLQCCSSLCSYSPLTSCCAADLCFSKNTLHQRCHPIASIPPQAHTPPRNEQIFKNPNPKKNPVTWLGF